MPADEPVAEHSVGRSVADVAVAVADADAAELQLAGAH